MTFLCFIGEITKYYGIFGKVSDHMQKNKIEPIQMILYCPECNYQHIDRDEWATRLHKTHLCNNCQYEWRPYEEYTVGVNEIIEVK